LRASGIIGAYRAGLLVLAQVTGSHGGGGAGWLIAVGRGACAERAVVSGLVLSIAPKRRQEAVAVESGISPEPGARAGGGEGDGADAFARSRECFEGLVTVLADPEGGRLTHAGMEVQLTGLSRELIRMLHQDSLDLRAAREERREPVTGSDGARRGIVEPDHDRGLATVFGQVTVDRMAYRRRGDPNLYPADAILNLPADKYSHGLARLAAIEAPRGSFEQAGEAITRVTGVPGLRVGPPLRCGRVAGQAGAALVFPDRGVEYRDRLGERHRHVGVGRGPAGRLRRQPLQLHLALCCRVRLRRLQPGQVIGEGHVLAAGPAQPLPCPGVYLAVHQVVRRPFHPLALGEPQDGRARDPTSGPAARPPGRH
jgi:hypothetical protein